MAEAPRRATLRPPAKINLTLLVLGRRPDGYHELRTVFQTISLADRLEIEYKPSRRCSVDLECDLHIENNLVLRAAAMLMDEAGVRGRVRLRLEKRIPMGGGLGGGSSDAAAVLLALPVLAGRRVEWDRLHELAARLGSDVPFFLLGGTALGLGRGTELYPLPSLRADHVLLMVPPVAVSTAEAYRTLGRDAAASLTIAAELNRMKKFQAFVRAVAVPCRGAALREEWKACTENDFEEAVFRRYPRLRRIQAQLRHFGAEPARLSGSGSALFGVFRTRAELDAASLVFEKEKVERVSLISRERHRAAWWRSLGPHLDGRHWPPRSRYGA